MVVWDASFWIQRVLSVSPNRRCPVCLSANIDNYLTHPKETWGSKGDSIVTSFCKTCGMEIYSKTWRYQDDDTLDYYRLFMNIISEILDDSRIEPPNDESYRHMKNADLKQIQMNAASKNLEYTHIFKLTTRELDRRSKYPFPMDVGEPSKKILCTIQACIKHDNETQQCMIHTYNSLYERYDYKEVCQLCSGRNCNKCYEKPYARFSPYTKVKNFKGFTPQPVNHQICPFYEDKMMIDASNRPYCINCDVFETCSNSPKDVQSNESFIIRECFQREKRINEKIIL